MNPASRTIAKNAGVMMVAQVVTWGLTFIVTIFVPRYLGSAGMGRYQLASSIWAMMAIFIGFGMDTLLAKEVARAPQRVSELLATSVLLRTGFWIVSFALIVMYTRVAGHASETNGVIYIIGFATLIWQAGFACRASLQGLERMEYISLGDIAAKVFLTVLTIIFLLKGYGLVLIALLDVGAALVTLTVQFLALARVHPLRAGTSRRLITGMLSASFPFLLLSGIMVAYSQIDIILLSLLASEREIGWYSTSMRLVGTFLFIPTVLMAALLPASSRMYKTASADLQRLIGKAFDLLLLVCIPIGLGLLIMSDQLVLFLYGSDFANGGPILGVMGIVTIFISIDMLVAQFFIASDRQNLWIGVMTVGTVTKVLLDFVLIPWSMNTFGIGALGVAIAHLVLEAGFVSVGLALLPKGTLTWKNGWVAVRVLLAGAAMAAAAAWARDLFIVIPIGLGIVVYAVCILALRVISPEGWGIVKDLGSSASRRLGWYRK